MVYINVLLTVKNEREIPEIRDLLAEQCRRSRREPGCVRFEVYQSQNDPRVFLLNEHWESQAALDVHRQAAAFKEIYEPKVMPRVERVPHPSTLVE
jgi:quinol monooxygenase YgiN